MSLVSAFTSAIAPLLAIVGLGALLGARADPDVEGLNAVALYGFMPALVFHGLATTPVGGETALKLVGGVVAFVLAMFLLAGVAGRLATVPAEYRSPLLLASAFPNAGFYGVPLSEFAFGAVGRTTAIVFMTTQSVLMYTLGAYVAARGGRGMRDALREVLGLPLIYAAVGALLARWLGIVPPAEGTIMTTVGLVGDATIPLMLVIVGVQLVGLDVSSIETVALPSALKLVAAPLVGLGIAVALAFETPAVARTFVLETATPVAVVPLALTIAYDEGDGEFPPAAYLTTAVFVTTLASVPVLTVLLWLLRRGAVV